MRFIKFFFLLAVAASFFGSLNAQDKDDEVVRVDTQIVDVPVIVTDKDGKPILNLRQSNFIVYEDGKRQEIADFSATAAPFEVAILLDTSGSTRQDLSLIKRAAENFIASLRTGDRVSIISFKSEVINNRWETSSEILSNLTDDRNKLKAALENVKTTNGTPYYDSLLQIIEKVFGEKPAAGFRGRRAFVALTDGVDSTSASDFDEVREITAASGVVSYFVQINTRESFESNLLGDCQSSTHFSVAQINRYYRTFYPNSDVEKVLEFCKLGDFERLDISRRLYQLAEREMQELAKTSGGKVFPVTDLSGARVAFKKVADEIGTKYSLGYYSSNEKRDGTLRKIKIELTGVPAGALVRAREGYTAPTN